MLEESISEKLIYPSKGYIRAIKKNVNKSIKFRVNIYAEKDSQRVRYFLGEIDSKDNSKSSMKGMFSLLSIFSFVCGHFYALSGGYSVSQLEEKEKGKTMALLYENTN